VPLSPVPNRVHLDPIQAAMKFLLPKRRVGLVPGSFLSWERFQTFSPTNLLE
jgi:hypothetical protein